jgi:hypothetical protein
LFARSPAQASGFANSLFIPDQHLIHAGDLEGRV